MSYLRFSLCGMSFLLQMGPIFLLFLLLHYILATVRLCFGHSGFDYTPLNIDIFLSFFFFFFAAYLVALKLLTQSLGQQLKYHFYSFQFSLDCLTLFKQSHWGSVRGLGSTYTDNLGFFSGSFFSWILLHFWLPMVAMNSLF